MLAKRLTVCAKTLEKEVDQTNRRAFEYIRDQIREVEPKLLDLFDKDAREFNQVIKLRRARDRARSSAQKAKLSRESNDLLETATENVFALARLCDALIGFGVTAFEQGWHAVRGDSGAAIGAAIAGVTSSIFIANLNLKSLKERRYASEHIGTCAELYENLQRRQAKAFRCVTSLNADAVKAIQMTLGS